MPAAPRSVVLLSGGMDSVCALYDARARGPAAALTFDYGSKHNAREIPYAAWHCRQLGVRQEIVNLDFIGRLFVSDLLKSGGPVPDGHYEEPAMKRTVVPFRNGILIAVAAGYAESIGAEELVIAAHAGDHAIYPDCRVPFMDAMAEAVGLGTYAGIRIARPFIAMDKATIARHGASMGIDYSMTWSCYKGSARHCGVCGTCVERREAFARAGLADPTEYADKAPPKN